MNIQEPIKDPELEKKVMVSVPDDDKVQNWFTDDVVKYKEVRDAGLALARIIDKHCPESADATTAIRKVREAVMTANAAIACCGK